MKKVTILLVLMLFTSFAFSQVIDESFETWPPSGWTLDGAGVWAQDDGNDYGPGYAYDGDFAAMFDCYDYSNGTMGSMITPAFEVSTLSNPQLSFYWWNGGTSYTPAVLDVYSSTNGTDFDLIESIDTWGTADYAMFEAFIATNVTHIKLTATSDWGTKNTFVDKFVVKEGPVMATLSGLVQWNATVALLPIEGATIEATEVDGSATSNESGEYSMQLALGTYNITCSAEGYAPQIVEGFEVTEDGKAILNFILIPLPGGSCDFAIEQAMNAPGITQALAAGEHWWYYFTTTEDMVDVVVSLCESSFDTKLAMFEACEDFVGWPSSGTPSGVFAFNDDGCYTKALQSEIYDGNAGVPLPGTLPAGTYYVAAYGYSSSSNGDFTLEITGNPAPLIPDPEFTVYELTSSIDENDWMEVAGDLDNGFEMDLIDWVEYHYLRLENAETNTPLDPGYHNFYLNQTSLPAGFFEYWAAQGVDGDPGMLPWQVVVWDIINGVEPMIVLNAIEEPLKDQVYYINDGFEILYNSSETYPRINGDYPPGTYTFDGTITAGEGTAVSNLSFDITFTTVSDPEFTVLDLEQSIDQLVWEPILGNLANGWEMDLLDWYQYYYINISDAETNMPIDLGYYPYYLDENQIPDPTAFYDYWLAKGVDGTNNAGGWELFMWDIINGDAPMFYLQVGAPGKDYSEFMQLVDGLQYQLGNEEVLRVSGDYPPGTYYFDGEIAANEPAKAVTPVTIEMTFNAIVPVFTELELVTSTDELTWTDVKGDLLNGFDKLIVPEQEYYYFNLGDATETSMLIDNTYFPFYLNQSDLPAGYFEYWDARGVDGVNNSGGWELMMWDIINGVEPMFYIKAEPAVKGEFQDFSLVDGLQYQLGQGDQFLRVNGSYPGGTYTFDGSITASGGADATSPISVMITFVAPLDVPYVQDFEGDFPPEFWSNNAVLGSPWQASGTRVYSGVQSAYHYYYSSAQSAYLISPPLDLSSVSGDVFLIYFENVNWASDAIVQEVLITTDMGAYDDPASVSWDVLNDVIGNEDAWKQNIIDISAYDGPVLIAFRYADYFGAEWWIDLFQIVETGDIDGLVSNLNSGEPEADVLVEIYNEDFYDTYLTDMDGNFLAAGLPPGTYDIDLSKDGFYPITYEDIIVNGGVATPVELDIEPVAPILLEAQYNDSQVTLEWEKLPEDEPLDNINGTTIVLNSDFYEPGQTLDLDFSFLYNSEDFEFICGFFLNFPDGVTVNSATDLDGNLGSSYLSFNGETGDGATCTWGIPNGNCSFGALYTSGDFVVNVTIDDDFPGLIEIPFTIYGDMFGNPIHEVSGTAELATFEFNIYRSADVDDLSDFEFLTTVMGYSYIDLDVDNGIEYCYYITQIVDGEEKAESQPSNTLCATPNLSPVIEVEPLSFFEVMNPEMIVTRTLTITNTTEGPLDLSFFIGEEPGEPGKGEALAKNVQNYNLTDGVNILPETTDKVNLLNTGLIDGELIWDNTLGQAPSGLLSCRWGGLPDGQQLLNSVDDFIIPEGQIWTIEEFQSVGFTNIGSVPDGFTVSIWEDDGGIPGLEVFTETQPITNVSLQQMVFTTPAELGAGHYWVAIWAEFDAGTDPDVVNWNWMLGTTLIENEPLLQDLVGYFGGFPYLPYSSLGLGAFGDEIYALYGTVGFTGEFISVNPSFGTIPAPDEGGSYSMEIDVIFNSAGFPAGYFMDELHIFSNDLNTPEVVVPVAMEIFQPFLEVEAGHYSNELTITPIPEEPEGTDDVSPCYVECQSPNYTAGTTMDLDFYLYFYSPDVEWVDGVGITFPTGVTVNSATDFDISYNGETGDGVQVTWGDILGGSGFGAVSSDQYFSVNVSIDAGFTGDIVMDWMIAGDFWGAPPNFAYGETSVGEYVPFIQSYNIYRDGELIEADWPETTYVDAPLPSVSGDKQLFCYTVTQNYAFIPPSAHSNVACGEPYGDGDKCELAFEYAIVDDPTKFGSTTYTGDFVWYSVENPETQDFFVSLCGSDFDTKVAVYESCGDWNGSFPEWYDYAGAIAYNDDSYTCGGGNYSLQSLTHVNWAAPGTYYVLIWGYAGEYGDYELEVYSEQSQLTRVGWGGLSSYVDLSLDPTKIADASMDTVFQDVKNQLVILLNETGIYWPGQSINTIGDFDTYTGHKAKWSDETTWIVEGDIVDDRSVTFPAGTHWLPVLNVTPVEAQGFITEVALDFMFDIDNGLIYWPDGGITPGEDGSLEYLFPGSAYLFRCADEVTFDFTPFAPVDYSTVIPDDYFKTFENNTTWNDVLKTGDHHIVGFSQSALSQLEAGDYIGVFNAEGICTGMQLYAGKESALAMPVNGNDITTKEVDGMTDQEFLNFRVYRDGQVHDVNAIYNTAMPNYDGLFNVTGLSQVTDFKFGPLSIEEDPMSAVMIYPNPSTGIFNIDLEGFENTVRMEVLNSRGQLIYKAELNASRQLDLTAQPQGVYFIRLVNSTSVHLEKVVIK